MTEPGHIRLLLVDDNDIVRMSLTVLLETLDGVVVVGEADNGQRAVELCDQLQPDIVLMDLVMPIMDGVTAIGIIHQQHPHIPILALSSTIEADRIEAALEAGAVNYLPKHVPIDTLVDAIHNATDSHFP